MTVVPTFAKHTILLLIVYVVNVIYHQRQPPDTNNEMMYAVPMGFSHSTKNKFRIACNNTIQTVFGTDKCDA